MFDNVLISQRKAKEIKSVYGDGEYFRASSPKLYGIGKSHSSAMKEVHNKIRRIAHYGRYQYATLDSLVSIQMGALTYVYPTVTFYRTRPVWDDD